MSVQRLLDHAAVARKLRRLHFAVLSTSDTRGNPASAGVTYGLTSSASVMYVMTRRHLQKARNIAANPAVSLVVPVPRRVLPAPPATIQLRGQAQIVDWTYAEGRDTFARFWLGRHIVRSYRKLHERGDNRICFLRIELDPVIRTYLVAAPIWRVRTHMEAGSATVVRPDTSAG